MFFVTAEAFLPASTPIRAFAVLAKPFVGESMVFGRVQPKQDATKIATDV